MYKVAFDSPIGRREYVTDSVETATAWIRTAQRRNAGNITVNGEALPA